MKRVISYSNLKIRRIPAAAYPHRPCRPPRHHTVDAITARSREEWPEENEHVRTSGRYRKSSSHARYPLAWMLPIRFVKIARIMSPMSATAQRGVSSPSATATAGEFDQRDEQCAAVRKRDMRLNHGLLHLAELGWYKQFSAAGRCRRRHR